MTFKYLQNIPRELTLGNIDHAISQYLEEIKKVPLHIPANNTLEFLTYLKREHLQSGPYPLTLFEAANRIMTDLTILFGVKRLLNNEISGINFQRYSVAFGNENHIPHDIIAESNSTKLIGEAFNVAQSFFQGKKASSLRKLRNARKNGEIILLLYNADAIESSYIAKKVENEYHVPVHLSL